MTYPDKAKIRAEIEERILNGQIIIPKGHLLDSKDYVAHLVKEEYKIQRELWNEFQEIERKNFRAELENDYSDDLKHFSEQAKDHIWQKSWESGHSGGFGEVRNDYVDNIDFALKILGPNV
jgi:hypothetical protein